jgi:hypothetical protein
MRRDGKGYVSAAPLFLINAAIGKLRLSDSPEVLVFYRERTNCTKLHNYSHGSSALSIKHEDFGGVSEVLLLR